MIDGQMEKILREHDHIYVRESITANALRTHGITKISQLSDSAFFLPPEPVPVPEGMRGTVAAINLSPLLLRRSDRLLSGFVQTAHFLLEKVNTLLLLPHVNMPTDNDQEALDAMAQHLTPEEQPRLCRVPQNLNAVQRKYLISRCELLICCRTHASIAGYSTGVPTLVVGYSVKSQGIGSDLGMERWVIPAEDSAKLLERTAELWQDRCLVRAHLLTKLNNLLRPAGGY